jgi:hypothetical protein
MAEGKKAEGEISVEIRGVVYFGQMRVANRLVTVSTGRTSKTARRGRLAAEAVGRRLLSEIVLEDAKMLHK